MKDNNFKNLLEKMPFGLGCCEFAYDSQGAIVDYIFLDVNPAFERMMGLKRKCVVGQRAGNIYYDKYSGDFNWLAFFEEAAHSGNELDTTHWFDGLGRYLKVTAVPYDHIRFVMFIQDAPEEAAILQLKSQKDEYKKVLQELEIVFTSTHDAISLVEYSGGQFRYIRSNNVHQELSGIENIAGRTPQKLLGEDVGERLCAYYEACMKTKKPVTYEQTFYFATGARVWLTSLSPVIDGDAVRYLVGSSKDITELKAAEKEKAQLTQRLESLFNQHTAIMLMIDAASGMIIDANPSACDFYGYTKEELTGLRIEDINMLPPDEVKKLRLMTMDSRHRYFMFPHRLKNGEIHPVDVYSCPITDDQNTLRYSIIFDVSDREIYRNELFFEKELFRTTLRSIGDGVVTTDLNGIITSLNGAAQDITGWNASDAEGRKFAEVFCLINENTGKAVEDPVEKVLKTGKIVGLANHTILRSLQGRDVPIADSAAPIKTEDGRFYGVVMVFRDVTMEKEHNDHVKYLSYNDFLTGLYNRRYIEEAMIWLDIMDYLPISVIMGDVNGLKITNDVFGHEAGDELLRHVARTLKECSREEDLVARWGGDEFVILMPRTGLSTAEEVVQKIRNSCSVIDKSSLQMSLSLGCAAKIHDDCLISDVMRTAEEYMYHQKLLDRKSYRNTIINTLLVTLYENSIETEEHTRRLGVHCHIIGVKLGLSSKELDELSLLAILHDIGKVGISRDILCKPTALTAVEWEEMKRHPEIAYRIAQATPELAVVAEYILYHHERWDGTGYPRGLKGEEIPLICRVLAVTDAYDAMINNRVYRRALSRENAVLELKNNAGTQFDADIVKVFLDILKEEQA